ncbi:MAG: hypothetical protein MUC36_23750, partial [Planctomycetes bacterium]|nr:hypothetical protein [Planctomycetota bacterium]
MTRTHRAGAGRADAVARWNRGILDFARWSYSCSPGPLQLRSDATEVLPMRTLRPLVLLLTASAAAQASFVVDANGGPGSQFTDIQAAVLAVPSGSVLVVRAGSYSPVLINGKGLTILCDVGAAIAPPAFFATGPFLTVRNTQPTQVVAVSGLGFGPIGAQYHDGILVENATGLVVLDGQGAAVQPLAPPIVGLGATLQVANSSQVVIRDLVLRGGARFNSGGAPTPLLGCIVDSSSVVFERCQLRGSDSFGASDQLRVGKAALAATNSRIDLVATSVTGGNGVWTTGLFGLLQLSADPAVMATNAQLVGRGAAAHAITGGIIPAAGALPSVQLDAIVGTGSLRIDPAIPVTGAVAASLQVTITPNVRLT